MFSANTGLEHGYSALEVAATTMFGLRIRRGAMALIFLIGGLTGASQAGAVHRKIIFASPQLTNLGVGIGLARTA